MDAIQKKNIKETGTFCAIGSLEVNPRNASYKQNYRSYNSPGQQIQQKFKRRHRRGKPKPKNSHWKFQMPKHNSGGGGGGRVCPNQRQRSKLIRSNSLAPYNTNRFLMEEHMVEVPLLTGHTRESSFSVDSEDNYFFSLPEDEEDFLTKEFSNVYERARVERLETLSKQELIQECLQIEDRFTTDQGTQSQVNIQRIRSLEQKIKELSRENYNLRCQIMRSNGVAAAASPPSAAAPTSAATQPVPMESSSEDTESDSSSSSSSSTSMSSSSSSSANLNDSSNINENDGFAENGVGFDAVVLENQINNLQAQDDSNQLT